jgi:excisionase family DNA binding protein
MEDHMTHIDQTTRPDAANSGAIVTREEAALMLATTTRHVRRLAQDGRLPFLKIGGKQRFTSRDVAEFIEASRAPRRHTLLDGRPAPAALDDTCTEGDPVR